MSRFITRHLGDKRECKAMEARAAALPHDYRVVYAESKPYLWRFATGDGNDILAVRDAILGLFETGAAQGRPALDVTGRDVAAFCDQRLPGGTSYLERWRASLHEDVARTLEQ